MPGIYIETYGCQMNEADSQAIAERALAEGYTIARRPQDASVVVVNTCTVRDNAETRAYGRINHFKVLKAADPNVRIVVAGCLAEQDRDRMQALVPHVDGIYGTQEIGRLGDAIAAWRTQFADDERSEGEALLLPIGGTADCITDAYSHLRAFVTVQRGCSYYCTFCIVPHVRGRFDHRPKADILAEVGRRLAEGAREVTLVGQTVNAYRDPAGTADFADLLAEIAQLDGLERLTFVTSHPKDFTEKLARTMGTLERLNPRFHLPMQSGSNPVLRRMNRKYTIEEYLAQIAVFREHCDGWALTTDLIVGFPGETEADFERTLDVCRAGHFAQAFMFVYSPRRGTPAARWEQLPPGVGSERLRRLADVVNEGLLAYHRGKVGTTVRALIMGPSKKDRTKIAARTLDNVTAIAPDTEGEAETPRPGEPWIDIRLDAAHRWGCSGVVVGRARNFGDAARPVAKPAFDLVSAR